MAAAITIEDRLARLACWPGPITVEPLRGGLTNDSYLVRSGGAAFVARLARGTTLHPIDRAAEVAASRAAALAGLAPEVVAAGDGVLVLRHVEGRTLEAADLRRSACLARTVALILRCRDEVGALYDGPRPDRTPSAILSHYAALLASRPNRWQAAARRHAPKIAAAADALRGEAHAFAHNDIHAANIIDDGQRLWLVDWEYAGFGLGLADIASLAVNGGLTWVEEDEALRLWNGAPPGEPLRRAFLAARLAAALRDLFWGYAQDTFGEGFDAADYIRINEARVAEAWARFCGP